MKATLVFLSLLFLISAFLYPQATISSDGSPGDQSAILDIISDSKGFLPPRLTTSQREAIENPAAGLMIYNTDHNVMEYFNGTEWMSFSSTPSTYTSCGQDFLDTRNGKSYATVQIGNQCWMAENLDIGVRLDALDNPTNNGIIEKYCYDDNDANCTTYGGLYKWNELMHYSTTEGAQGICPDGWHIPTDGEFCELEQHLDPTISCTYLGLQGTNAGTDLKVGGSSGFEALMSGELDGAGGYIDLGQYTYFWLSTEQNSGEAYNRRLNINWTGVQRGYMAKSGKFSVRCMKD